MIDIVSGLYLVSLRENPSTHPRWSHRDWPRTFPRIRRTLSTKSASFVFACWWLLRHLFGSLQARRMASSRGSCRGCWSLPTDSLVATHPLLQLSSLLLLLLFGLSSVRKAVLESNPAERLIPGITLIAAGSDGLQSKSSVPLPSSSLGSFLSNVDHPETYCAAQTYLICQDPFTSKLANQQHFLGNTFRQGIPGAGTELRTSGAY
jgi:hypothetical protein